MKLILLIGLVLASSDALAQTTQRVFENERGQTTGRAVTDSYGRTNYYNERGQTTGRSVTDSRGNTTVYDNMGRTTARVRGR
jgi:hypothetical protein